MTTAQVSEEEFDYQLLFKPSETPLPEPVGKIFCYQYLFLINAEIGIDTQGFTEVNLVLEEAVEKAEERSAIFEFDAGLERTQADKNARVLNIQPVLRGLARKGLIVIEGSNPGMQITTPAMK